MRRGRANRSAGTVARALRNLTARPGEGEAALQVRVACALNASGIWFLREVALPLAGGRIDFLAEEGVGVEVKVGHQSRARLAGQAAGYLGCEALSALVVVSERRVPERVRRATLVVAAKTGKPVLFVELAQGFAT